MSEITWTGSPDDMTARVGDYTLKVQQRAVLEWAVYFKGVQCVHVYPIISTTIEEAKAAAINAMKEHLTNRHDKRTCR